MTARRHADRTDYDHPAALRRAPRPALALALAALPLALAYALGHPYLAATALTALAVLAVTRGRPEL